MQTTRIRIAAFRELNSEAGTIHPTIAEHVRATADEEALAAFGEERVLAAYRDALTTILFGYNIVLDGEDLYCAGPHGLETFRRDAASLGIEPIAEARSTAGVIVRGPHLSDAVAGLYAAAQPIA